MISSHQHLLTAARNGFTDVINKLISNGVNVNETRMNDIPLVSEGVALIESAKSGTVECLKLLIDHGADINLQGLTGRTALSTACRAYCLDGVKLSGALSNIIGYLLDHGADINAQDRHGFTPLMYAFNAESSNVDLVKLLIDRGADLSIQDNTGRTAVDLAREYGHKDIAVLMSSAKAHYSMKKLQGEMAYSESGMAFS